MAGPTMHLPGAALRKVNVDLLSSGQGSASPTDMNTAYRELAELLPTADLTIEALTMPLSEVEAAWNSTTPSGTRIVPTP